MGWRSQEKLKSTTSSTSLVTTPAQRLAVSSIKKPSTSPRQSQGQDSYDYFKREKAKPKHDNTALHESIKQVTGAIDDFCKSSKRSRRPLTSKGTYEGLMEAKQFHTGGHLWMESSFLPTKSNLRASSARARLEGFNLRNGGVRLEDQIFWASVRAVLKSGLDPHHHPRKWTLSEFSSRFNFLQNKSGLWSLTNLQSPSPWSTFFLSKCHTYKHLMKLSILKDQQKIIMKLFQILHIYNYIQNIFCPPFILPVISVNLLQII